MVSDSNVLERLQHILDFQMNDITNALHKVNANFLVAQGCMHNIEFLGGVRNGELGIRGKVESRFKEGVRLLGGEYTEFGVENMYELRNSLTHEYLPKVKTFKSIILANVWTEIRTGRAITFDPNTSVIRINLAKLVNDVEQAGVRLRNEIMQNIKIRINAESALSRLPKLL